MIVSSPKLKYVAHQKHEGHNRKSTRLSISLGILPTVALQPSRLDKVSFLWSVCFLSINIWWFTRLKYNNGDHTLLKYKVSEISYICKDLMSLGYNDYWIHISLFFIQSSSTLRANN
jgi:hypothetical protein